MQEWDDNGADKQALILAFDQLCQHDEFEQAANLAGAKIL